MLYDAIQPPFTYRFRELDKSILRAYFRWFLQKLPEGVDELLKAVRLTPGYEAWEPNCSPDSLDLLGKWFSLKVEMRDRTYQEIEEIRYRSSFEFDISDKELTDQTFSIAVDIAMYMSCLMLHNHPELKWDQPFGSKKFIDYGQPVLIKFTYGAFNPVRMMTTMAHAFADNTWAPRKLREVYDLWSAHIKT